MAGLFGFFGKSWADEPVPVLDSGERPSYEATLLGRMRHQVERRFLPEYFFSNPTGFMSEFTDEYGFYVMYAVAFKECARKKIPYWNTDFATDVTKTDSGDYLAIAELPAPDLLGLCYRMYFLFDAGFEKLGLYTVELTEDGAQLCRWDADGNRITISAIETGPWREKSKEDKDAELQMVADSFNPDKLRDEPADAQGGDDLESGPEALNVGGPENGLALEDEPAPEGCPEPESGPAPEGDPGARSAD